MKQISHFFAFRGLGSLLVVTAVGAVGCGGGDGAMDRVGAPDAGARAETGTTNGDASSGRDGGGPGGRSEGGASAPDAGNPGNGGVDGGGTGPAGDSGSADGGAQADAGNGGDPDGGTGADAGNGGNLDSGAGNDAGNGGENDAGNGTGDSDAGGNGTGDDDAGSTAATWTDVWQTFDGTCNTGGCHGFTTQGDLDMSTKQTAYDNLVGMSAEGGECAGSGLLRVEAGSPDTSLLVRKLEEEAGIGDTCGDGMPQSGGALTTAQIDAVRSWIDAGAQEN